MAYPIDSEINDRMDAFRSNPNALMQRYNQSREFIDLIALQKLKSEKEAAARDVKLSMQNNPNTIKAQREQELLDMTKDELVKQTSGLMALNKAKQQNNVQKVANMGVPTANRGIAGQPAPNMQRLAGGGIVGFASSGVVNQRIQELRQKLKDGDITRDEYKTQAQEIRFGQDGGPRGPIAVQTAKKSDDLFFQTLPKGMQSIKSIPKNVEYGVVGPVKEILQQDANMTNIDARADKAYGPGQDGTLLPQSNIATVPPLVQNQPDPLDKAVGNNKISSGIGQISLDNVLGNKDGKGTGLLAPEITWDSMYGDVKEATDELKKKYVLTDKDAAANRARTDYLTSQGIKDLIPGRTQAQKDKAAGIENLIAEKQAFYDQMQDPEKLRQRELSAFLRGTANRGGFGSAMAGGSAERERTLQAQEQSKIKGFESIFGNKKDLITMVGDDKVSTLDKAAQVTTDAFKLGEQAKKSEAIENAAKMKILATLDKQQLDALTEDKKMFYNAKLSNLDFAQKANLAHAKMMVQIAGINMKGEIANLQAKVGMEKNRILEVANNLKDISNKSQIQATLFTNIEKLMASTAASYNKIYADKIAEATLGLNPNNKQHAVKIKQITDKLNKEKDLLIKGDNANMMALQKRVISTLDKLSKQNMTGFKLLGKK